MYLLLDFRYQISRRCFILWRHVFRTSQFFRCSVARLTNRPHVISEAHRISIRSFLQSSHRCIIQSLRHRESLLESSKQFIAEGVTSLRESHRWENHIAGEVTSLREFARKLQIELVRIQSRWHKRLLWENVENTVFANVLCRCCSQNPVDIIWRKQN